jgi:hypothetical protein
MLQEVGIIKDNVVELEKKQEKMEEITYELDLKQSENLQLEKKVERQQNQIA